MHNSSGIFYDSANLVDFKKWFDAHILGGATTNPVILQKEGIFDIPKHISKMIKIAGPNFPISIEIPDTSLTYIEMVELGQKYAEKFPKNAVIKVPMDPLNPEKGFEVMYKLGKEGIRVNATLGLSAGQLISASEAMRGSKAKGDNYVSLFWARRDEAQEQIVKEMTKGGTKKNEALSKVLNASQTLTLTLEYIKTHNLNAKVIIGSVRSVDQVEKAFLLGAHIVTIPPKLISEWMFTKRGVETAEQFNEAYRSVKDKVTLI